MSDTTPEHLTTEFVGDRQPLFWLALRTGFWTIVTLGFYRFWMKTKLRRWYWSAIRPGGLPLEYVGDPLEKLLGFLIVVVMMAFYIGVVNLILMFLSLSFLASSWTAYLVSFLGVIPLWFFALYRMRRYVLARTRWRGVRFGLKRGAWGYAGRALLGWMLAVISVGLLWPRMTFQLEKFKTDRTVFGSATLHQGGTWTMLVPYFAPTFVGLALSALTGLAAVFDNPQVAWLFVVTVPWTVGSLIYYRTHSVRLMANLKSADTITLTAKPKATTVARIYVFGYIATIICIFVPLIPILVVVGFVAAEQNPFGDTPDMIYGLPIWVWTALGALTWFAVFLMWSALRHCFVTMPLWRHFAQTLTIESPLGLAKVSQRDRDAFTEAEGFAEALDMGAAI